MHPQQSEIIENCRVALAEITDTAELERKAADLSGECEIVAEMIRKCVEENAHISVDQNAYAEKYGALAEKYADCKERLDAINEEISRRNVRKSQIAFFLDELARARNWSREFSTGLWNTVVDSCDGLLQEQGGCSASRAARKSHGKSHKHKKSATSAVKGSSAHCGFFMITRKLTIPTRKADNRRSGYTSGAENVSPISLGRCRFLCAAAPKKHDYTIGHGNTAV